MSWRTDLIQISGFFYKIWLITKKRTYHIFEILFWPVIGLVSVGLLTRFLSLGSEMVAFILVGVIALSVVQIGQLDMSYLILYSIWNKSLKHEMAAPIGVSHIIIGTWTMGVVHSVVVFVLLSLFSAQAFGFRFLDTGLLPLIVFFMGLSLTSAVVGILVCAMAFRFGGRSHVAANSIVSVLALVSGIYYPVEVLPESVRVVSFVIPLTYFLEYFRSFFGFTPTTAHPLVAGYALVTAYLALACLVLTYSLRHSQKSGILLRMSE